jgi:hypothetical protein
LVNVAAFGYHWVASAKLEMPSNRTPRQRERLCEVAAAMTAAV